MKSEHYEQPLKEVES